MRTTTIASVTRTMFLVCLFCGMVGQTLHSQTNIKDDLTVTNRFYSPVGKFVKASNKDCLVWSSFPRDGESVTWTGGVIDEKACGTGVLQWFTNGVPTTSYEGDMKDGFYHGHGISKVGKNGASWEGDWERGSLVSKTVTIHYGTGGWYKGEQKGGFKDGEGEEAMVGGKYIGHFKHDHFDGQGEMILSNGGKITGEWAESKLVGAGFYTSGSGETMKVKQTDKGIEPF